MFSSSVALRLSNRDLDVAGRDLKCSLEDRSRGRIKLRFANMMGIPTHRSNEIVIAVQKFHLDRNRFDMTMFRVLQWSSAHFKENSTSLGPLPVKHCADLSNATMIRATILSLGSVSEPSEAVKPTTVLNECLSRTVTARRTFGSKR